MRALVLFFIRYYSFFLFLLLETLCVFLLVQNKSFHRATYFNSANYLVGNLYQMKNSMMEYIRLGNVNEQLAAENAWLKTQLHNTLEVAVRKSDTIFNSETHQQYVYVAAKVINNSVNKSNNYLTLDLGNNSGVEQQMGVICPDGVVGIVKNVSGNFASVISVLHKDIKLSAKVKKNGYFGSLSWTGYNTKDALLTEIPKHAPIQKGDTIVTSGYSSFFPDNILIGIIEEFELKEGDNFYKIKVRLSTNFQNLDYVYVVKNILREEKIELEETSQKNQ